MWFFFLALRLVNINIYTGFNLPQFRKTAISSPLVPFYCSCDKVDLKQQVSFLLHLLGQDVTWHNLNPFNWSWLNVMLYMIMIDIWGTIHSEFHWLIKYQCV